MTALLTSPDSALRRHYESSPTPGVTAQRADTLAASLAAAALYWVSADMTALATAAAAEMDSVRWTQADRPSASGLMVFDGGAGWITAHDGDFPADALSWGPAEGGMLLSVWAAKSRMDPVMAAEGRRSDPEQTPPLIPIAGRVLPVAAEFSPAGGINAKYRTLATTLAAAWHLMHQPTLAERVRAEVDPAVRRSYSRAGRPDPEVTLVDLRTLYRPGGPGFEPDTEAGRYSHRWVVRGHWRNQPHGRGRELRKRIWVPDYVKGPDGAPLLVRERVNVWRR